MLPDLRTLARALGGEVVGRQVLAPGPGHGRNDRSLSIKLNASSPFGFLAHSFAGDDFTDCRDYVVERLGLDPDGWKTKGRQLEVARDVMREDRAVLADPRMDDDHQAKIAQAVTVWKRSFSARGTLAEKYLNSRSLILSDDIDGEVLRWQLQYGPDRHIVPPYGDCPQPRRLEAIIALFRNIETGDPQAITRIYLDHNGKKIERKFLGPVGGAAVMLDAFDEVTTGLHICEGVETGMFARQLGFKPTWALGSAGAIRSFPVLSGVECLTILAENDTASSNAANECAARWHAAGREVFVNRPIWAKDLNDIALKARA